MRDREIFSPAKLLKRVRGNERLLREIIGIFLMETPRQLEKLHQASVDKDLGEMGNLAHKLRGAAAIICAEAIVDVALQLESAGKECPWDAVCMLVKRLEEEFVEFKKVLSDSGISECSAKH